MTDVIDDEELTAEETWAGWVYPVAITDGRIPEISDKFQDHVSEDHRMHTGVDICFRKREGDPPGRVRHTATLHYISPEGTAILAAGPGKIWSTGETERGKNILVDHGDVPGFGPMCTWYQHLASFEREWKKGDVIAAGDLLGRMGYSTLDGEQFRHLHFQIHNPTDPIDPAPYVRFFRKTNGPRFSGLTALVLPVLVLIAARFAGVV